MKLGTTLTIISRVVASYIKRHLPLHSAQGSGKSGAERLIQIPHQIRRIFKTDGQP